MNLPLSIATLFALAVFSTTAFAADRQLPGRVLRVIDGDSLILEVGGSHYRIELDDIDAPELNQPWGQVAASQLRHTVTGGFAVVQWKRTLADGAVQGRLVFAKRDVGLDLVLNGLAWCTSGPVTGPHDHNRPCGDAEADARSRRVGLWSDESPIPPWEWRRPPPQPPR